MADLMNEWRPPTLRGAGSTSSEVVAGLEGEGGVLMWPRFHRVRRYGCLASRGYSTRAEALHRLAGRERGEPAPLCACPACGGALACVMVEDEDGEPTNRPLLELRSSAEGWAGLLAGPGLARVPWEVPA